jgi:hypothetical protein
MADSLVLAAPPRAVPLSLQLRVRLGGVLPTIGWALLAFGLIFSWAFVANSELMTAGAFDAPLNKTEGRVLAAEATSIEVNGSRVVAVDFEFSVGDTPYRGTSWTRGRHPSEGDTVQVEYVRGKPALSRIPGMSTAPMPAAVGFVLILPLVGLVLVGLGAFSAGKRVHLLRHGKLATGRLVDSQPTNTKINNRRVMRMTFEFVDDQKQVRQAVARSHRTELFQDATLLLYEAGSDKAVPWQTLPGKPTTDANGELQSIGLGGLLPVLILPTIIAVVVSLVSQSL